MNAAVPDAELILGVVIDLPEALAAPIRAVRMHHNLVRPGGIPEHITLVPPVRIRHADLPAVTDHLSGVAARWSPFSVRLRGTGTFRPQNPVVFLRLSAGVEECGALQSAVHSAPLDHVLEYPYHPHVTVAHLDDQAALDEAMVLFADTYVEFTVAQFTLYRRSAQGPWLAHQRFALGPAWGGGQDLPG